MAIKLHTRVLKVMIVVMMMRIIMKKRSGHSQTFFQIAVLKNFANSTGKQLCWRFFLINLDVLRPVILLKTGSNTGAFPTKFVNLLSKQLFT